MTRLIFFFILTLFLILPPATAQEKSTKIAIIKADDVRNKTAKWDRFFALSKEKGVKVSAGIICKSLYGDKEVYYYWLQKLNSSGQIEFWNHGWDHKRWMTDDSVRISEFSGSGYAHQKKHFDDSQKIIKTVLGKSPIAFGAPYNAIDSIAIKVMNEDAQMRLFFSYRFIELENKVLAQMNFRGEHDGTGKPNFEKFKAEYMRKKDVSFSAIQFHPNNFDEEHFTEYAKIIDFLISEGWSFMLPTEYVYLINQTKDDG